MTSTFKESLVGRLVAVRTVHGASTYHGTVKAVDASMNLVLENATEESSHATAAKVFMSLVFLRGSNVYYILPLGGRQ